MQAGRTSVTYGFSPNDRGAVPSRLLWERSSASSTTRRCGCRVAYQHRILVPTALVARSAELTTSHFRTRQSTGAPAHYLGTASGAAPATYRRHLLIEGSVHDVHTSSLGVISRSSVGHPCEIGVGCGRRARSCSRARSRDGWERRSYRRDCRHQHHHHHHAGEWRCAEHLLVVQCLVVDFRRGSNPPVRRNVHLGWPDADRRRQH